MSSWPSAFTLTSALSGCCVQKRRCLLLVHHHNDEHIQKHKLFPWKLQLALNHSSPSSYLQTWSAGEGKGQAMGAPSSRHAAASQRHSHAELGSSTGTLVGCCVRASDPGLSGGVPGADEATSRGAGGAAGWEGCSAPPSPLCCARDHITGHPSLSQRFTSEIRELVNQSSFAVTAEKDIFRSLFQYRRNHASSREFHIVPLLTENANKRHATGSLGHL